MMKTSTERAYQIAAVQNASAVGVVIILFDLLIADLACAINSMASGEIEKRCAELNHAFLVLQQLEGSLDMENGGEAARSFSRFYSTIRAKLLEAHIKISPAIVQRQIELLLDVRVAWQQVDQPATSHPASAVLPLPLSTRRQEDHGNSDGWNA